MNVFQFTLSYLLHVTIYHIVHSACGNVLLSMLYIDFFACVFLVCFCIIRYDIRYDIKKVKAREEEEE